MTQWPLANACRIIYRNLQYICTNTQPCHCGVPKTAKFGSTSSLLLRPKWSPYSQSCLTKTPHKLVYFGCVAAIIVACIVVDDSACCVLAIIPVRLLLVSVANSATVAVCIVCFCFIVMAVVLVGAIKWMNIALNKPEQTTNLMSEQLVVV